MVAETAFGAGVEEGGHELRVFDILQTCKIKCASDSIGTNYRSVDKCS